jgi:hypothetical protein
MSIATGRGARTLTSQPSQSTQGASQASAGPLLESPLQTQTTTPLSRKRGRGVEHTPESRNRERKASVEDPMVAAINRSIDARKPSVVRAVELLSKEYLDSLTDNDFIDACKVLTNSEMASTFITLPNKRLRDLWLKEEAGVFIIQDVDNINASVLDSFEML